MFPALARVLVVFNGDEYESNLILLPGKLWLMDSFMVLGPAVGLFAMVRAPVTNE
jgi:hypothetical protein